MGQVNYICTLTDDQDANPVELPITSLQTTWRNFTDGQGDSYLEFVVPDLVYMQDINNRVDGTARIYRNGVELFAAQLDAVRTDQGPNSQSASLRCRTQWTNPGPVARVMVSGFLISYDDSRQTWRGPTDGLTMPGDTVTIDDGSSFEVETLTYISSGGQDEMILVAVPPGV